MGLFDRKNKNAGKEELESAKAFMGSENISAAVEAFEKSAEMGNREAQYLLGKLYEEGKVLNNPDVAAKLFERSYDQGCWRAGFRLARLNALGLCSDPQEETAVSILASAFEMCDDSVFEGSLDSMYDIGEALYNGKAVFKDSEIGIEILQMAADLGEKRSIALLERIGLRTE